jgi:hypothetical protein
VRGYKNGIRTADSVDFYLADYRFTDNTKDYILKTWEWVDCGKLGLVDSIYFNLTSSDVGAFGINTPTYFCLDNFTTSGSILTGITQQSKGLKISAYPNPFKDVLTIALDESTLEATVKVMDITGKTVSEKIVTNEHARFDLSALQTGIYFLEVNSGDQKTIKKLIKN